MIRLVLMFLLAGSFARADTVRATVDLSDQRMFVSRNGALLYSWDVSTARAGKFTPQGVFTPYLLERMHYSTLYDNAPMPWSIFFVGTFAIHGTTQVDRLGAPASAGCVRLAPDNAKVLYDLVREVGMANTRVVVRP